MGNSHTLICGRALPQSYGEAEQPPPSPPSSPEARANNGSSLLSADATAELNVHSVQSSFRFSFAQDEPVLSPAAAEGVAMLPVSVEEEEGEEVVVLQSLERSISSVGRGIVRFTYGEISSATRGFCRETELSRGPLSRVYRGRIGPRRRSVAIKHVKGQCRETVKAFCRELLIASSLQHPNVVPLLGFYAGPEGLFLVYNFVSGGSLDRYLHNPEKKGKVLPWDVRYKVAVGVARAVQYLHRGTDKCVVHRDIKPANILLASNKTPKLCDFGLATWTHGPFLCKAVKGTFGYLAPEYFLLEAMPLLQGGAIEKLMDPRLKRRSYCRTEMSRMVHTARACVNSEELGRPSIDQVIRMLQGEDNICSSVYKGNSCPSSYASQSQDPSEKSDMRSHLALAMLGISDVEEDDLYGR